MAHATREEPTTMRLVGFRVTEVFRKQIEAESIERNMSAQDLITHALERYFEGPREYLNTFNFQSREELAQDKERRGWDALWLKFMNTMPREKILVHADAMKFDLLHYKSSRKKKASSKKQTDREIRK